MVARRHVQWKWNGDGGWRHVQYKCSVHPALFNPLHVRSNTRWLRSVRWQRDGHWCLAAEQLLLQNLVWQRVESPLSLPATTARARQAANAVNESQP